MELIDGRQIRAARSLVGLEQRELARLAGVNIHTLRRIEKVAGLNSGANYTTVNKILRTLYDHGVLLTGEGGKPGVQIR